MGERITAKFDHNWRLLGGRSVDPVLRDAFATVMEGDGRSLHGALAPFRRVPLSKVPGRPEAHKMEATTHTEWPEGGNIGKEPMNLLPRLQRRAHEVMKGVCSESDSVEPQGLSERIARDAGRFTDIIVNPTTSLAYMNALGGATGDALDCMARIAAALDMGYPPQDGPHGLRVSSDRHARTRSLYLVNRRNMVLGLGDGEFSYDYGDEHFGMRATYAFDVSRAVPGLVIRVEEPKSRELPTPPARRRTAAGSAKPGRIEARLGRDWGLLDAESAGPFLRTMHAAMLKQESSELRWLVSLFSTVGLEEISDTSMVRSMSSRTGVLNPPASADAASTSRKYRHWKTLGLFSKLNRAAHETIVGMCTETATVSAGDLAGYIGGLAGKFTDVIADPSVSMYCAASPSLEDIASVLGLGSRRPRGRGKGGAARRLPVRTDRWIRSGLAYCVNRRNMLLGLGDGKFWYDYGTGRIHMSARCAFDVSRAAPGLAIRVTG